jgi:hypothetical protein
VAVLSQTLAGFTADKAVDLSKRDVQARLSRAAVPAFFKLAETWGLKDEAARHLLGASPTARFTS